MPEDSDSKSILVTGAVRQLAITSAYGDPVLWQQMTSLYKRALKGVFVKIARTNILFTFNMFLIPFNDSDLESCAK